MKVIVPVTIDDSTFVDCTVQETDYPAWTGTETYALGDMVVRPTTHRVYQALQNGIGAKDVRVGLDATEVLGLETDGAGGFAALISDTYANRTLKLVCGKVIDGNIILGTPVDVSTNTAAGYSGLLSYDSKNKLWLVVYQMYGMTYILYTVVVADGLTPSTPTTEHICHVGAENVLVDGVSSLRYVPAYNRMVLSTTSGVMVGVCDGAFDYVWGEPVLPSALGTIWGTSGSPLGEVVAYGETTSFYPYIAAVDVSAQDLVPVWGTPVVVESVASGWMQECRFVADDISVRRFLAVRNTYIDGSSNTSFYPCSVSGVDVTVGTRYASGLSTANCVLAYDATSRAFAAMYETADGTAGYGVPVTLEDDDTVTFGTPAPFTMAYLDGPYVVSMGDGNLVYLYQDESDQIYTGYNIGGPARFGVTSVSSDGTTLDFSGDIFGVPELMTVESSGYTLWLDAGATNRWRQFDTKVSASTTHTCDGGQYLAVEWDESADSYISTSAYEARPLITRLKPGPVDSLALINASGCIAQAVIYDSTGVIRAGYTGIFDGIESWTVTDFAQPDAISTCTWDESADTYVLEDTAAPIYGAIDLDDEIEILLHGYYQASVSIGETVVGYVREIGGTQKGITAGITDYSIYKTDEWGDLTITKRGYSKRVDIKTLVETGDLSSVYRYLSNVRATPLVWIPSPDEDYSGLVVWGKYKEFTIDVSYSSVAYCTLSIDGLI